MQPQAPAPTTSGGALQQLQQFQAGAKNPTDMLSQQQQQLGVPQAQQQVSGLRSAVQNTTNLLNNVAPSIMGRTGNSLVTNAQANAQIQNAQAPINSELTNQNAALGNATQDYNTLEGQATNAANLEQQGQTQQESYLQNIYNALFQQEQASQANALEQQKLALASSQAGAGSPSLDLGGILGSLGGGTAASTGQPASAQMASRPGGGFNFTDANGTAISAAQFAATKNIPFRTLLQEMANSGDTGAKTALGFVGNDYGYDPTKVNSPALASLYNALVGGTGRTAKVSGSSTTSSPLQSFQANAAKGLGVLKK